MNTEFHKFFRLFSINLWCLALKRKLYKATLYFFSSATITKILILSVFVFFDLSCSRTETFYYFAHQMVLNRIDNYFDLTPAQKKFLNKKIQDLIAWHKANEIIKVRNYFDEINVRLRDGLSIEETQWFVSENKKFWSRFIDHSLLDFSNFLTMLNSRQIEYFKVKLKERNQDLIDKLNMADADLLRDSQDRLVFDCEKWLGPITKYQKNQIRSQVQNSRFWYESRVRERRHFNKVFIGWLVDKRSSEEIKIDLRRWLIEPETILEEDFRQKMESRRNYWINLVLFIDSIITEPQRKNIIKKFQVYIDEIDRFNGSLNE